MVQLTQRLLQQKGAKDEELDTTEHPDADKPSNPEENVCQEPVCDASEEVVQQQHEYMIDDEELDPMGWGFSIDQP